MTNPWRGEPLELTETIGEGLADRADLKQELQHYTLRRPDFLILEEIRSLRFLIAAFGGGCLMVSVASFALILYAILE